jgi:hypothetical protein
MTSILCAPPTIHYMEKKYVQSHTNDLNTAVTQHIHTADAAHTPPMPHRHNRYNGILRIAKWSTHTHTLRERYIYIEKEKEKEREREREREREKERQRERERHIDKQR